MAVRNGKKASFVTRRGSVIPTYRKRGPVSRGIILEMPEVVDPRRMIMRSADMSVRIIRSVSTQPDFRISVIRLMEMVTDQQTLIVRHIDHAIDTKALIWRRLRQDVDIQSAVYSCFMSCFESSAQIVRLVDLDADAKQSIYVYLLRESHEISV